MREMAKMEIDSLLEAIPGMEEEIRYLLLPADPEDEKNAVMEIRAGTGGDEASIFAGDLFRMYSKYIESMGWKLDLNYYSEGTAGGYKEVVFTVIGDGVYGILKYESGAGYTHQRPPWQYCLRPVSLTLRYVTRTSGRTPTVHLVPADRVSTPPIRP